MINIENGTNNLNKVGQGEIKRISGSAVMDGLSLLGITPINLQLTIDDEDDDEISRPKSNKDVDRINRETGNFETEYFNLPYNGPYEEEEDYQPFSNN